MFLVNKPFRGHSSIDFGRENVTATFFINPPLPHYKTSNLILDVT